MRSYKIVVLNCCYMYFMYNSAYFMQLYSIFKLLINFIAFWSKFNLKYIPSKVITYDKFLGGKTLISNKILLIHLFVDIQVHRF